MPRDFEVYLEDILQAISKIRGYTAGLTRESFAQDSMRIDAVIRNLEIIGEAAKMIPESMRGDYPSIEWKKIAGLRDILAHHFSKSTWTSCGTFCKTNCPHWNENYARNARSVQSLSRLNYIPNILFAQHAIEIREIGCDVHQAVVASPLTASGTSRVLPVAEP